jgi:integrase
MKLKADRSGTYHIHWREGGRSKRRSTGTKDKGEAADRLAEAILEQELSAAPAPRDYPVSRALTDYFKDHGQNLPSSQQIEIASRHLTAHFGRMLPKNILRSHCVEYREAREEGEIGRPATAGTIRRELGTLATALNHAVRERRLPASNMPHLHLPDEPPAKDRWLTPAEAEALREAAQFAQVNDPVSGTFGLARQDGLTRCRLFVEIALATGARRRSIEQLEWSQVDLARKLIYFNKPGRAQTAKKRPTVPISDALYTWLEWARAEAKTDFVLLHSGSIRTTYETAVARAGLQNVTRHTLRHTWATWAAQRGVSLFDIAGVLGDNPVTVQKRYAHHCPNYLRTAVNF